MEGHGALCEYEKLVIRMNSPRVVIDNAVCATSTVVKVDSARKHGVLLEAVQVLTDLNLSIKKAYIASDGRYFMDVFHVTDQNGNKVVDTSSISYIEQSLVAGNCSGRTAGGECDDLTALELTGTDRPGLLSEVFAVLANLDCDVVEAKMWTHNGRIASLIYVKDGAVAGDAARIAAMEAQLRNVLKGDVRTSVAAAAAAVVHSERRLHQMMFADRDYERPNLAHERPNLARSPPPVSVDLPERGYSVVKVVCPDRDNLVFDVVCNLTDMDYVVFHASVDIIGSKAYQEFYIRHADGTPVSSEAERIRVVQCLQAAIERRASAGIRLELCTVDRQGLLAEVTRTFRENGLSVTRAEVSTSGEVVKNVFYVTDAAGHPVDAKTIEAIRHRVGLSCLKVKEPQVVYSAASTAAREAAGGAGVGLFSIGSLVKKNLYNLGLIKSCS